MIIHDEFPQVLEWRIEQLATDISRQALARARAGRYSQLEVNRGVPARLLVKYFERQGLEWQIAEPIRRMVKFEELNLNGPWPAMPAFDIVFVRNVMIYFNVAAKKRLLGRVHDLVRPDGFVFLGAAETTVNLDDRFTRAAFARGGCYTRVSQAVRK